jgi:hypothetical protein
MKTEDFSVYQDRPSTSKAGEPQIRKRALSSDSSTTTSSGNQSHCFRDCSVYETRRPQQKLVKFGDRESSVAPSTTRRGVPKTPRKVLRDITITRPAFMESKKGTSGRQLPLQVNCFRLIKRPDWSIHNYYVDFQPTIESKQLRKQLIYEHKETLGGYLFDGQTLYLTKKLPDSVTQLVSETKTGEMIRIIVKYTTVVPMTEASSLQILNLVLKRAMEALQLQLVGKNFFDPAARVSLLDLDQKN